MKNVNWYSPESGEQLAIGQFLIVTDDAIIDNFSEAIAGVRLLKSDETALDIEIFDGGGDGHGNRIYEVYPLDGSNNPIDVAVTSYALDDNIIRGITQAAFVARASGVEN